MSKQFIQAGKFLRDQAINAPLRATIADLAAHHIVSVCPTWATSNSVKGLLGCVIRTKAWLEPKTRPINQRQTMAAITC